jgi:hypothetical protein
VRLATALVIGQAMGVIRDGDPRIMAVLLIGMLREPVVQAWLHQRPIDDAVIQLTVEQIAQARAGAEGKEGLSAFLSKAEPSWCRQA